MLSHVIPCYPFQILKSFPSSSSHFPKHCKFETPFSPPFPTRKKLNKTQTILRLRRKPLPRSRNCEVRDMVAAIVGSPNLFLSPSSNPASTQKTEHPHLTIHGRRTKLALPITKRYQNEANLSRRTKIYAKLRNPRGFGPAPKKAQKTKKPNNDEEEEEEEEEEDDEEEAEAGVIPEVVTNRMMSRMGFSVGIPLFVGLLFFPFFYYLKVGLKIDVPTWVPFIVSFFFFGSALAGVSYGIVSSSWDPLRQGSLLGWTEAQKNWPVFWQSLTGGKPGKK